MYVHLYVGRKNKGPAFLRALVLYGAGTRSRTRDLLITSQLLTSSSSFGSLRSMDKYQEPHTPQANWKGVLETQPYLFDLSEPKISWRIGV